jgi:hypothetical protein
MYYLDIKSLTRLDTAMCNGQLRPYFLELCKEYIVASEIYTISEYYKYIYLRGIKVTNLIIFNNRQLQLFYRNILIETLRDMHITYLSISDCCIDNNLINLVLTRLSKLKVLKIGIFKFTNCLFDEENNEKYELTNIYSNLCLLDNFTYCVNLEHMTDFNDHIFRVKNNTFDFLNIIPLGCPHDVYLLDDCKMIDSLPNVADLIPLRYAIGGNGSVINIMNNVVGDIGKIGDSSNIGKIGDSSNIGKIGDSSIGDILPLEELHIHNTHNLTYANIIPLLKRTRLKKLSLHFCAEDASVENILEIFQYNIPFIEIVNKRLSFDNAIDAIIALGKNIKILKIYINNDSKINITISTDDKKVISNTTWLISITTWNTIQILSFKKLLLYCINIEELVVNTSLVFHIIKKCDMAELLKINLKKIRMNYLNWPLYFDEYITKDDINYLLS